MLFESTAILNYLEATRPLTALAPTDARDRALVDMHTKLCDLQFTRQVGDRCASGCGTPRARGPCSQQAEHRGRREAAS